MTSAPSDAESAARMVAQLLVPRLARPSANRYALTLLGRLACCDTGLRDLVREHLASRRAAQAADEAALLRELELAVAAAAVQHYHDCLEDEQEAEAVHKKRLTACVRSERVEALRRLRIAPQLMTPTPYADALRELPRKYKKVHALAEDEQPYCYLGTLGVLGNSPLMLENDPTWDYVHSVSDFVRGLWEELVGGVMHNGWDYDDEDLEDDVRQRNVPGHSGRTWEDPPLWF